MLQSLIDEQRWGLRGALGVVLAFVFLLKFFFGTLVGVLLSSVVLYFGLPYVSELEPWSLSQMVLWFDELGNDAKVGLASSLVTVLGFFIALHTTMHSWQRQTAAAMRIAAADAIDAVISEVNAVLLRIHLYSEATGREVGRVRTGRIHPNDAPKLSLFCEDALEFRADRRRLLQLEQEVIALPSRYAVLFLPLSGMQSALEAVEEQVSAVTKQMWVFAPADGSAHPEHRVHLLQRVEPEKHMALAEISSSARDVISRLQGGIRGALLSPVLEANPLAVARTIPRMFSRGKDVAAD